MTLILYARRRGWSLDGVTTELSHERAPAEDHPDSEQAGGRIVDLIRLRILVRGDLSEEQRERLLAISRRCPVHRLLTEGARIVDEMDRMD